MASEQMQQAGDLRGLTVQQLETKLTELKAERFRLGFRSATEPVENPMRFRTLRRDIARVHTVLGEKRREA